MHKLVLTDQRKLTFISCGRKLSLLDDLPRAILDRDRWRERERERERERSRPLRHPLIVILGLEMYISIDDTISFFDVLVTVIVPVTSLQLPRVDFFSFEPINLFYSRYAVGIPLSMLRYHASVNLSYSLTCHCLFY